jgi:hypothetical protein
MVLCPISNEGLPGLELKFYAPRDIFIKIKIELLKISVDHYGTGYRYFMMLIKRKKNWIVISVSGPDSLNTDTDPGILLNPDPDFSIPGILYFGLPAWIHLLNPDPDP